MRGIPTEPDCKAVALSGRLFQRLLAAYPKAYRREYGQPMAQLFRDQCRDSWRAGRGWGLAWLWLRVLPDLVKTSVSEHISTLKERNTMLDRIGSLLHLRSAPRSVFSAVFVVVFLLVVGTCTFVTFLLPNTYASTARIKVDLDLGNRAGQAEFEAIESETVLSKVIDDLDLNQAWGRKCAKGDRLTTSATLALLKERIELRPVRGTSLIEIRAFSEDRNEAAALANAVADTYREHRSLSPVEIVDKGVPGLRPVRPNKPLNIALGVMGGMLLALVTGAGMAGAAAWLGRRSRGTGAPTGTGAAPLPDLPLPDGRRNMSALDRIMGILWMGIGGVLSGLALVALLWFLISQQFHETSELLPLPLIGLFWGCNAGLGLFLSRGKQWARICLGVEGLVLLICFSATFWLAESIGGPMPNILRWGFIALGVASVCTWVWPRKQIAPIPR